MLGDPAGLAHHVGVVDDKRGGNETLHPLHRFQDFLLGGMVLRHIGRAQHDHSHAAGKMSRVNHRDVLKGLCRLAGILISHADMLCHGDVDYVLSLHQLLGKEPFVVLYIGRLRIPFAAFGNVDKQLIRLQLLLV